MIAVLAAALLATAQAPASDWEIVVLGIAQDAGIPHLGCQKPPCTLIRAGKRKPEKVSCLGLRNKATNASYLFDATPDIVAQLGTLNGGKVPDGVFLTHGHMGHYTGLVYFGRESVDAKRVPVFGSKRMGAFLAGSDPWRFLVSNGNIAFHELRPDEPTSIEGGVKVTSFFVPHRDEFTDTFGYLIEGPRKKAVFIPDIDRWEKLDRSIRELADRVDLLFLDGTFSSPEEVGGRDIAQIPHPMMPRTRELLAGARGKLWFIHLNHTNPALGRDRDVAREGQTFGI